MRPSLPTALALLLLVATVARAAPEADLVDRRGAHRAVVGKALRAPSPARAASARSEHRPGLPIPIAVGQYRVTREDFTAFAAHTGRTMMDGCLAFDGDTGQDDEPRGPSSGDVGTQDDPALCITVEDAAAYVAWLSRASGHELVLPHEAEWTYSARAGATTGRGWGDEPVASYRRADDEVAAATTADGSFGRGSFGMSDMLGDVWNWSAMPALVPDSLGIRARFDNGRASTLPFVTRFWLRPMADSRNGFRSGRADEREVDGGRRSVDPLAARRVGPRATP